jgi:hypothetical protein
LGCFTEKSGISGIKEAAEKVIRKLSVIERRRGSTQKKKKKKKGLL